MQAYEARGCGLCAHTGAAVRSVDTENGRSGQLDAGVGRHRLVCSETVDYVERLRGAVQDSICFAANSECKQQWIRRILVVLVTLKSNILFMFLLFVKFLFVILSICIVFKRVVQLVLIDEGKCFKISRNYLHKLVLRIVDILVVAF